MLRIRSRTVTSKQTIVGDHTNQQQQWFPPEKPTTTSTTTTKTKTCSSFFNCSSFFKGFFSNKIDPMMNPISILDKSPFSVVSNFWVSNNTPKISSNKPKNTNQQQHSHAWEQSSIGLALIDENFETDNKNKQQNGKLVVFGSQLRIRATKSSVFPCFSPDFPTEFGIKTPRNKLWSIKSKNKKTQVNSDELFPKNEIISGINCISMSEIDELSEDYTCVISHGPNPKTTHIFGNCIVENCCGKIIDLPKKRGNFSSFGKFSPSNDGFLSFCEHCKKKLGDGHDIFMYR
ncbi:hypothetical protein RND81_02G012800 [Saponaria officinalis]